MKQSAGAPALHAPAEEALEALFERLAGLERETAALSDSLRRFRDEWRDRVGPAEADLFAARRLEERIARLSVEAAQWASRSAERAPSKRRRRSGTVPPAQPSPRASSAPVEPWIELKDLYRLVARRLHPDLAANEVERARRSELMARVNAAYARGDRVMLELVQAREASADVGEPTREKRQSHAERRLATLLPIAASLEKQLGLLRNSSQFRDLEKARLAADRGGDYFAEASYGARRRAKEAVDGALRNAAELAQGVQRRRGSAPKRPAADPTSLLRRAARRFERRPISAEAERFSNELRRLSAREPWQAALSLFAFFAEASPEPPPGLVSLTATGERYDRLRESWPSAPAFDRALVRLPPFLEVGLRAYSDRLAFGLQLKLGALSTGVHAALTSPELLPLSRRVFETLGPRERCAGCGETVFLVHLFRTRGLDVVHGLVCPACAGVQRSYRSLGRPEGLEALAPYAVALGLVRSQVVHVGRVALTFDVLPEEQRKLTVRGLIERLDGLYFAAISPHLARHVHLRRGRKNLPGTARLPDGATLRLALMKTAELSERDLTRALRASVRAPRP